MGIYRTSKMLYNLYLLHEGFVAESIEREEYEGRAKFNFNWDLNKQYAEDMKDIREEIDYIKDVVINNRKLDITEEEFKMAKDKYWSLIREYYPRRYI